MALFLPIPVCRHAPQSNSRFGVSERAKISVPFFLPSVGRQRAWPRLLASISFLPLAGLCWLPHYERRPFCRSAAFVRDGYNNNGGSSLQCYVWCNVRVRRKLCCSDCGSVGRGRRGEKLTCYSTKKVRDISKELISFRGGFNHQEHSVNRRINYLILSNFCISCKLWQQYNLRYETQEVWIKQLSITNGISCSKIVSN